MKVYEIDFKDVKTYSEFYPKIIKSMGFPSWCGENPDAIWDMLTWEIYTPCVICLKSMKSLPKDLQGEMELLLKLFKEASEWYEKFGESVEIKEIN